MAGNKVNTKTKGKEDKVKSFKGVTQVNEEGEDIDFAILRKPIPTSITGFAQARKIFDLATEELKDLLSNECDMLYECKVCRSIFRSLANFISHKRVYCKEKFNSTQHGHFISSTCATNEILQIKRTEIGYQESLKAKNSTESNRTDENDDRVPLTKDLTTVYEKLMKTKGVYANKDESNLVLKKIPSSNVAVFQNQDVDQKTNDNMRAEVKEIDTILSRDLAVLQSDGKFIIESSKESAMMSEFDRIIQISDDEENDEGGVLKCKICDLQFSTQKTLKFHMKYKHLESRLVFPCPDCLEIFSTSWSVYRHLFKVHRKTAAQIRRLRESIQAKAFKMDNPPAFYEKRKNIKTAATQKMTDEERLDQENQAWMDNMEGDGEVPRCGGCGRTFERRAALAAHTHTCQPRSRALARRPDTKKIEIQIRKDYNKGPNSGSPVVKPANSNDNKVSNGEDKDLNEETKATCEPQDDDKKAISETEDKDNELDDAPMDIEEDDPQSNDSATDSPEKTNEEQRLDNLKLVTRLPYALQAEKSNLAAFKQRICSDIDASKLLCKKCNKMHSSGIQLYEHMADHFKWMRYTCKLCNYKHYKFEMLPEHVKVVHKLKGDSDFYFSTVKAIDGVEAMIISKCMTETEPADETNDLNETSPRSRRPSRCSSDSSRLSDDSSSSSTFKEIGSRKRKVQHSKGGAKRRRDPVLNDDGDDQKDANTSVAKALKSIILGDNNNSSNDKTFEENCSDIDEPEYKMKRQSAENTASVASRRPVRKRTKVKNEDFEYDLSNLLKKEAQGYRDSQTVTTVKAPQTTTTPKTNQTNTTAKTTPITTASKINQPTTSVKIGQNKKKGLIEIPGESEIANCDWSGALATLSKKAVEIASAHMKTSSSAVYGAIEQKRPNMFVRPMVPRFMSRSDKVSPKKDAVDESGDNSPIKAIKLEPDISNTNVETNSVESAIHNELKSSNKECSIIIKSKALKLLNDKGLNNVGVASNETGTSNEKPGETASVIEQNGIDDKAKTNLNIPAVVPIKFRRPNLELMKNPLINKNIKDFSKAGMKTKILVIKPINRNHDKSRSINNPLKYQTIKFKDPSKGSTSGEDKSDQVMVVEVPEVPCTAVSDIAATPVITDVVANSNENAKENKCEENESVVSVIDDKTQEIQTPDKTLEIPTPEDKKCESNETDTVNTKPVEYNDDVVNVMAEESTDDKDETDIPETST